MQPPPVQQQQQYHPQHQQYHQSSMPVMPMVAPRRMPPQSAVFEGLPFQHNLPVMEVPERRQPVQVPSYPPVQQLPSQGPPTSTSLSTNEEANWIQSMSPEQMALTNRLMEMLGKQLPNKPRE